MLCILYYESQERNPLFMAIVSSLPTVDFVVESESTEFGRQAENENDCAYQIMQTSRSVFLETFSCPCAR